MQNLFAEKEEYDLKIKQSRELRRNTYIIVMLLFDDTYDMHFEDDVDGALKSTERNFYLEHYDFVTSIFPRAKNVLNKSKLLDE